jgi:hypothetical protein
MGSAHRPVLCAQSCHASVPRTKRTAPGGTARARWPLQLHTWSPHTTMKHKAATEEAASRPSTGRGHPIAQRLTSLQSGTTRGVGSGSRPALASSGSAACARRGKHAAVLQGRSCTGPVQQPAHLQSTPTSLRAGCSPQRECIQVRVGAPGPNRPHAQPLYRVTQIENFGSITIRMIQPFQYGPTSMERRPKVSRYGDGAGATQVGRELRPSLEGRALGPLLCAPDSALAPERCAKGPTSGSSPGGRGKDRVAGLFCRC